MTVPTLCPKCRSTSVRKHCIDSPQCDLVECGDCRGFGTPDARLWAVKPER